MSNKTCLLDAICHAICLPMFRNPSYHPGLYESFRNCYREYILESIGHDGSERGFHTQEIQDAIRPFGFLLVQHQTYPAMQLPAEVSEQGIRRPVVAIYEGKDPEAIFLPKLRKNNGVLVVRKSDGLHHALGFEKGSNTAYDVHKDEFINLEELDIVMFLELIRYEDSSTEQRADEMVGS